MNIIQLRPADLKDVDGEPRVLDLRIAERLGFAQGRDIRKLIARNAKLLEMHGELVRATVARTPQDTAKGGHAGEGYWLNESQTVALAFLSSAPDAVAFQKEVIAVWQAYRRGDLVSPAAGTVELSADMRQVIGGITKAVITKQVPAIVEEALARRFGVLGPDEKIVKGYLTSLEIIRLVGIKPDQGSSSGLSKWIGDKLTAKCSQAGIKIEWKKSDDGQRLRAQFNSDVVHEWLHGAENGAVEIKRRAARRMSRKAGQHELRLVQPTARINAPAAT